MTAEIAIMNKNGIALAADSAVTIGGGIQKHNNANKLFMLSNFEPVGIMLYNNAEFMGVPWEIIIKEYRKQLKDTKFEYLEEYADDFLNFLLGPNLPLKDNEEDEVKRVFFSTITWLIKDAREKAENDSNQELKGQIFSNYRSFLSKLESYEDIPHMVQEEKYLFEKYSTFLEEVKSALCKVFNFDIEEHEFEIIRKIFRNLLIKEIMWPNTGIVIAGYGKNEIFPSLVSIKIQFLIGNNIKYIKERNCKIDKENDFYFLPFAQEDVVQSFIYGIDLSYYNVIEECIKDEIMQKLKGSSASLKKEQLEIIEKELADLYQSVTTKLYDHSVSISYQPFANSVRTLPKEELASMAESLVNLTSLKRHVSINEFQDTVGGPIDVAVISKGDGFIWIKRKHYFSPEFNHHYFQNKQLERGHKS